MQNFVTKLNKLLMIGLLTPLFFITSVYAAETVKIMPLGDSLTKGGGSADTGGFREPLLDNLNEGNYTFDFVGSQTSNPIPDPDHEGHDYNTSAEIAANIDGFLVNNHKFWMCVEWFTPQSGMDGFYSIPLIDIFFIFC